MIRGTHTKVVHWIEGIEGEVPFVVRVEADAVIPEAAPHEPCLELRTMRWLEEIQDRADVGDLSWPANVGEVLVRRTA